jgi:hypothetical protein
LNVGSYASKRVTAAGVPASQVTLVTLPEVSYPYVVTRPSASVRERIRWLVLSRVSVVG